MSVLEVHVRLNAKIPDRVLDTGSFDGGVGLQVWYAHQCHLRTKPKIRTNVLAGIQIECTKNTLVCSTLRLHLNRNRLADKKLAEGAKELRVLDGRVAHVPCTRADLVEHVERRLVLLSRRL